MTTRHAKIIDQVKQELVPVLTSVLEGRISQHYSQAQWEAITAEVATEVKNRLTRSVELADLSMQGDLYDLRGNPNKGGILTVLQELAEKSKENPGKFAKLKHLSDHAKLVIGYNQPNGGKST